MTPPIFRGWIKNGKIKLDNRERFVDHLIQFEGKRVEIVLRECRAERSDEQNRYYWGVVIPLIGDYLGYTPEEIHEEIKRKFNIPSTTKLKKAEFNDFLAQVVRWAAAEFHVVIPDPGAVEY